MPNGRKQRLLMKWGVHKAWCARLSKNINSEVKLRRNMCKFCNNKPKAIISSIKQKTDVIEMVTVGIEGGNTLKIIGTLQSPYFVGVIPLETETKISYCPMCGKKLRED